MLPTPTNNRRRRDLLSVQNRAWGETTYRCMHVVIGCLSAT